MTTVRGITSSVSFTWSSADVVLKKEEKFTRDFTTVHLDIYSNTYTISPLSVNDHGQIYQCDVVISVNPPAVVSGNITLDVTGMN